MNCPECGIKIRGNSKSCSCGWSVAAEAAASPLKYVICSSCRKDLPWPSGKQVKNDHRIVGYTSHRDPICNQCYETKPEPGWKADAFEDFARRHQNAQWGALIRMSYSLKGASREDCAEFMGYLKDEVRKSGGMFGVLPYDKAKREPV